MASEGRRKRTNALSPKEPGGVCVDFPAFGLREGVIDVHGGHNHDPATLFHSFCYF